ncbi:cytochrome b [Wenzhouxiangella marina]|uniref:Uncharacterized protein n=1 Tax=Wenzhouxiangella marina TaxID=1579979 RepID=A0A0K0XZ14_9GAMM|nr:cytochrome b [Wenzhouxiangella marina]AKS42861.1 hypothetical protein WM2015_2503 [Wenzhouxiangella marina]MBB6087457.1 cytochrome b561 [Wenzhouxiangella marina]
MNAMPLPFRNTRTRFGLIAQSLHWAVVIGLLLQFIWAWRIDEAESIRQQFALVNQHKSIGLTVFGLALIRLAWRFFDRPPAWPESMRAWERLAASLTHWALYGLILAIPLSGWAWSTAAGHSTSWFGALDLPALLPVNENLADILEELHEALAISLLGLAALHVLAALRHQFVLRDGLMRRILGVDR